ncbi:MAG: S8 family peptidase [Pelobium sp.]
MMNLKFKKSALLVLIALIPFFGVAQKVSTPKPNWQNLDLKTDTTFGISTEKAYQELLKGKKANTVIVAVIDGGVDINHEDLKDVIYSNPKEKVNKKDDDKNGYVDDENGWNFLGGPNGDVEYENLEVVRLLRAEKVKFENVDSSTVFSPEEKTAYLNYMAMKADVKAQLADANYNLSGINGFRTYLGNVVAAMGKENPTRDDFEDYSPKNAGEKQIRKVMLEVLKEQTDFQKFKKEEIDATYDHFNEKIAYQLNIEYNPRNIVGDDENDMTQHYYGNADVTGPDALHGSHVAGIIAAERDNKIGINGVANHVKIMSVRTVPNGDERDKDVANAIRYATDNGAKVINMSFGKGYSPNKETVDEAVKYAVSKDVLLIHAAGNENINLDEGANFPNRKYQDNSGEANAWIEVGASGFKDNTDLKASFSNYGKTTVDVFAPGVAIYSTTPNSTYTNEDGTSMAAPVVSGLAALIRSYYPKLSALQVKDIILKSVTKVTHPVILNIDTKTKKVPFTELCISGGIVNAYNALKLAESMSGSLSAVN